MSTRVVMAGSKNVTEFETITTKLFLTMFYKNPNDRDTRRELKDTIRFMNNAMMEHGKENSEYDGTCRVALCNADGLAEIKKICPTLDSIPPIDDVESHHEMLFLDNTGTSGERGLRAVDLWDTDSVLALARFFFTMSLRTWRVKLQEAKLIPTSFMSFSDSEFAIEADRMTLSKMVDDGDKLDFYDPFEFHELNQYIKDSYFATDAKREEIKKSEDAVRERKEWVPTLTYPELCRKWDRFVKYVHESVKKDLWKEVDCMDESLSIVHSYEKYIENMDRVNVLQFLEQFITGEADDRLKHWCEDDYQDYFDGKESKPSWQDDKDIERVNFVRDGSMKDRKWGFISIDRRYLENLLNEVTETSEGAFDMVSVLGFLNKYRYKDTIFKAEKNEKCHPFRELSKEERANLQLIADERNMFVSRDDDRDYDSRKSEFTASGSAFVYDEKGIRDMFAHLEGKGDEETWNHASICDGWTAKSILSSLVNGMWSIADYDRCFDKKKGETADFIYLSCPDGECEGDVYLVSKRVLIEEYEELLTKPKDEEDDDED